MTVSIEFTTILYWWVMTDVYEYVFFVSVIFFCGSKNVLIIKFKGDF